jgi:hypothetical protein
VWIVLDVVANDVRGIVMHNDHPTALEIGVITVIS